MGEKTYGTVFRFVIATDDGRYSAVWRVWTGDRRPTDEVYLSPRGSGDRFKVSIHSDGWAQVGLDKKVRDRLTSGDKHALERWKWREGRRWRRPCAFALVFFESELRPGPEPDVDVLQLAAPPAGYSITVLFAVLSSEDQEPAFRKAPHGFVVVRRLSRRSGGVVLVLAHHEPARTIFLADARRTLHDPLVQWELPVKLSESGFAWTATDDPHVGVRAFAEIAGEGAAPLLPHPHVVGFSGTVRPWKDLPLPDVPQELCGALLVLPDSAELFFNSHRRCRLDKLARDAERALRVFRRRGPDDGWDEVPGTGWVTGLMTAHPSAPTIGPG